MPSLIDLWSKGAPKSAGTIPPTRGGNDPCQRTQGRKRQRPVTRMGQSR